MLAKLQTDSLCIVSLLILQGISSRGQELADYRMEGFVTEEGTNRPVPGATVQVLIESERMIEQKIRSAKTDVSGHYSVPLPVGHGWVWHLQPPAGYSPVRAHDLEQFATTPDQPAFKKDFQVRKGVAWPVVVRVPTEALPLGKTFFSLGQQRENDYFSVFCEVGDNGRGVVTMPSDAAGEFKVNCGDLRRLLTAPDDMKLIVAKGFRTDRVNSFNQLPNGDVELRDDEGRTATLHGARAEVKDGAVSLVVEMKLHPAADNGLIVGRVIDSLAQPLAGAEVEAAFHSGGGSATSSLTAISQTDGTFRLVIPKPSEDALVSLIVTKDGFAGIDTEPRSVAFAKSQESDFGSIKLRPGCSIRIRVVSPQGQPLAGAIVEPSRSYAARAQIARTDADGFCTLRNLAAGVAAVSARFGTLTASTKLPLVEGDNEPLVLKLSPPRPQTANARETPSKALQPGTVAPEWQITEWTDGSERKLVDYRGKVVVLDFWGVWCGPCVSSIPALKQLHERYKNQDVVFLAIHTAGTDMSLIKRLLKQQQWQAVTGLDVGDDIVSGASVRAFAIEGFPTVMVMDRQGRIAFNSGYMRGGQEQAAKQFMERMEGDAKSLSLPWPIDKDATEEQITERLNRLQVLQFSREIDRALKQN